MRGENSEDIIFNGAKDKQPLNSAQVTLVFDNTNGIFKVDFNEVQITRKACRNSSENEYYINKARVRLKDVQEIIMGTGLAKGSLAIISQGNVSKFADSKPEERRSLFEEAAGVSKYKKRKEESLRKLERTNDNLTRVNDIISEVHRKIEPLAKQAHKAKAYLELRDTLKKYEITIIVKDLTVYQQQLLSATTIITNNSKLQQQLSLQISNNEQQLKFLKNKSYDLDKNINSLEMNISNINILLQVLEQQKTLIQNKTQQHDQSEVAILKSNITDLMALIEQKKLLIVKEQLNFDKISLSYNDLDIQYQDLMLGQNNLYQGLGDKKAQLAAAINYQIRSNQKHLGVQTILDNKEKFSGIIGVVSDLITVPELYTNAIITVLGNALKNIVTATSKDATKAVAFLKQNQAGIATFLPLNALQVRTATKEDKIIVASKPGFLNFAYQIVTVVDNSIQPIVEFLLGRTIVCETLEHARVISQLIAAKYQCVTLDGQLIKAGGVIVGGYHQQRNNANIFQEKRIIEQLNDEIKSLEQQLVNINVQTTGVKSELHTLQDQKVTSQLTINKLTTDKNEFKTRCQLLMTQYQTLTGEKIDISNNTKLNDIFVQYETTKYEQNQTSSQLQVIRKQKHQLLEQMQKLENELYT